MYKFPAKNRHKRCIAGASTLLQSHKHNWLCSTITNISYFPLFPRLRGSFAVKRCDRERERDANLGTLTHKLQIELCSTHERSLFFIALSFIWKWKIKRARDTLRGLNHVLSWQYQKMMMMMIAGDDEQKIQERKRREGFKNHENPFFPRIPSSIFFWTLT